MSARGRTCTSSHGREAGRQRPADLSQTQCSTEASSEVPRAGSGDTHKSQRACDGHNDAPCSSASEEDGEEEGEEALKVAEQQLTTARTRTARRRRERPGGRYSAARRPSPHRASDSGHPLDRDAAAVAAAGTSAGLLAVPSPFSRLGCLAIGGPTHADASRSRSRSRLRRREREARVRREQTRVGTHSSIEHDTSTSLEVIGVSGLSQQAAALSWKT